LTRHWSWSINRRGRTRALSEFVRLPEWLIKPFGRLVDSVPWKVGRSADWIGLVRCCRHLNQRARISSRGLNWGAMLSRPKAGPNPAISPCRGRESMSYPNARGRFADCSMLSGLASWESLAIGWARKHGTQECVCCKITHGHLAARRRHSTSTKSLGPEVRSLSRKDYSKPWGGSR